MSDREKIKVERRRKGDSPDGKSRAQAPSRRTKRETGGQDSLPPIQPSQGRPSTPGGGVKLPLWLVVALAIVYIIYSCSDLLLYKK